MQQCGLPMMSPVLSAKYMDVPILRGCSLLHVEGVLVNTRTRLISSPQVRAEDLLHSTCTANEGLVRIQYKCLHGNSFRLSHC